MSNSLAIGAVTAAIRNLLDERVKSPLPGEPADPDLSDAQCTARAPDKARLASDTGNTINLFLYQMMPNAAMRNMPMPGTGRDGDLSAPPLALTLYYLLTPYGAGNDEVKAHRMLGRAMSILHARGRLERADITAIATSVPGNDLLRHVERIRITPHNVSTEEMSKLWTIFQTNYRLSVAYEVSVVLIDNIAPSVTPLPVLTRGPTGLPLTQWSGPRTSPSLIPPSPALDELIIEEPTGLLPPSPAFRWEPGVRLGMNSRITLRGHHLDGTAVAQLATAALPGEVRTLPTTAVSPDEVQLSIPNDPTQWPAGFYTINLSITKGADKDRNTNALSFTIAPQILSATPNPVTAGPGGTISVAVGFTPQVRPNQRVSLLVDDVEAPAPAHPSPVAALTFVAHGVPAGTRWLRLRVDGVDSLLVDDFSKSPPVFNPSQSLTVL
jgi:hypothetical protein